MKDWWNKTHGPGFELLRHFLLRFFESESITSPGHTAAALIGAFSILLPWFPLFVSPLRAKYTYFSHLSNAVPYRHALRADELWLATLMMAGTGLLVAWKWNSMFPSTMEYRTLAALPLRPRQIFLAKLLALLLVTSALIVTLNVLPGLCFPLISGGRWAINLSPAARVAAHMTACIAGSYFCLFGFAALQGLLLNVLPPRLFRGANGYAQGLAAALMLVLIVLSFSIDARFANFAFEPAHSRWLPPVWFVGLYESRMGDQTVEIQTLAGRAWTALGIAVLAAMFSYVISYGRHRRLLLEGALEAPRHRAWAGVLLKGMSIEPRQQAIFVFLASTLKNSSEHRTILMGYCGFGLAILLSGVMELRSMVDASKLNAARFLYAHFILLIFLLLGLRHLFAIPIELRANWLFQITEGEGRGEWLRAVDRFVLALGATVLFAIPLPFEISLLRWRAASEAAVAAVTGLVAYEWIFSSTHKLPFTCSRLPGKTPPWVIVLQLMALGTALPVINAVLLAALYQPILFLVVMGASVAGWARLRSSRMSMLSETRLTYEEFPDPAVHSLNLLR